MEHLKNWAGNYRYHTSELHIPENLEQVRECVVRSNRVKVLGTRHSFNGIADSSDCFLSLQKLIRVVALDRVRNTVTVEAGIRYGELCQYLHKKGYALHNLASLPHINVAGACATASHGSGDLNGSLATAVHAMELVRADGEVVGISQDQLGDDFYGAVVGLGGLGIVTKVTLKVVPAFQMSQCVYENLPLEQLKGHFHDIFSSAYSVSLFTDWTNASFHQVWLKRNLSDPASEEFQSEFFGAVRTSSYQHPVLGISPENCSEQMGVPGPWYERLPHFRMDFMPSAGKELQSEYFVPRQDAYAAIYALFQIREYIAPHIHVSEIRTIAADYLWMSPCYKQDSVGIHFTWKANRQAVWEVLPLIEKQLEPFQSRPHWGKLFTMPPARLQSLYEKLPAFQQLLQQYDPAGKFRNTFLNQYIR